MKKLNKVLSKATLAIVLIFIAWDGFYLGDQSTLAFADMFIAFAMAISIICFYGAEDREKRPVNLLQAANMAKWVVLAIVAVIFGHQLIGLAILVKVIADYMIATTKKLTTE